MTSDTRAVSRARVGIDTGGTFTDFALIDLERATTTFHKQLSTPHDPSRAILAGLEVLAARCGRAIGEIDEIVHGTTLVTNALIERRGATTGMLVTAGFESLLDIGKEQRYDLYDLNIRFPEPVVPRTLRRGIAERLGPGGSVLRALDDTEVLSAVGDLVDRHGIKALAICYLHSYANGAHEERTRHLIAEAFPDLSISTSSDIFPYPKEFERWTTATVNAYTQPVLDRYLINLESGLANLGFRGKLTLIGSSGSALTPVLARRYPVHMLESGPAAGVLMACNIGRDLGLKNVLSFDLGGTTAKGALIRDGKALKGDEFEAARVYNHKSGSGLPLRIPAIDLTEIGAGGGSIAEIDDLQLLQVGPRSAGADPGPVCYARGGDRPTLTDANLVLGYLDPAFFLGGRMALDSVAAFASIEGKVAAPLGLHIDRAAWGIHEVINEDIVSAFRLHAIERGFDTRRAAMVAFGGGGPIHGARIARKLKIPTVVFPAGAGVMSARGMLTSRHSIEVTRSFRKRLSDLDPATFGAMLAKAETESKATLVDAGVAERDIGIVCRVDMRYVGQGFEIQVELPPDIGLADSLAQLGVLFDHQYKSVYGFALNEPKEIVSWRIEAFGPEPVSPGVAYDAPANREKAKKGTRQAWFPRAGGMIECPVFDRYALREGDEVSGPALIEEYESTCLIDAGDVARIDRDFNIVVAIGVAGDAGEEGKRHD